MAVTDLAPEVHDLAVALGVLDADGGLRPGFFANPLGQAAGVLRDADRREALGDLIDALVPADRTAPTNGASDGASGETWHLLTDRSAPARVYLTVRPTPGAGMVLGLAVRVTTEDEGEAGGSEDGGQGDGRPGVTLTIAVGLVEATDGGLRTAVGTDDGPVRARVEVTAPTGEADDFGFEAVALDASLTPAATAPGRPPVALTVTVRGLRIDGQVLPPIVVDPTDPTHLDRDLVPLLQSLLGERLRRAADATGASAALVALADHLLPLLGLAGAGPRLPIDRIGAEPGVVGAWFAQVLDAVPTGGGPAGSVWIGHLAGLLGLDADIDAAEPTGTGTTADPWRVPVAVFGEGDGEKGRIELTLATRTTPTGRELLAGVAVRLAGPEGIALEAGATLVALPLTGTGAPRAVSEAQALVRAPADPAGVLVATDALHVGSARAGLRWDGTELRPVLELAAVTFEGHTYDLIDLAHVDSVRAAAADAVRAALADALGDDGPGAHLAVLLGLLAPAGEQGAPLADPVALLTGPTRELARVHRHRLTDAAHPWSAMLAHLAALLGATAPVTLAVAGTESATAAMPGTGPATAPTTGTDSTTAAVPDTSPATSTDSTTAAAADTSPATTPTSSTDPVTAAVAGAGLATAGVAGTGSAGDPWRVAVVAVGPLSLELAAWTAGAGAGAGDPELHLGLRLAGQAATGPATAAATVDAEIVALAFPADAPVTADLVAHHTARLSVTGPFVVAPLDDASISLGGVDARLDWHVGEAPEAVIELSGLTVHLDDADVTVPALRLPPAGGFAPDKPDLGLGVPVADLDRLARALLARLWQARAGDVASVASELLGLVDAAGLPGDWPALQLPAGGVGGLLSDPLAALRSWLTGLLLDLSAEGAPFVPPLLDGLRRLARPDAATPDVDFDVPGSGTWTSPWRIELGAPGASQLLLWLGPDGPPTTWAAAAAAQTDQLDAPELLGLMGRFGADLAPLAAVFGGPDGPAQPDRLAAALTGLLRDHADGDGVVPVIAQLPDADTWSVAATLVDAAHHRLPEHPDAVAQVLAEVDARAPGADRTVLLLGPPFTDRASWQPLLDTAEAAHPGATDHGAHFDLRTPPSPDRADLAATTAAVSWYTADLADGGGALDPVVAQIAAVVGRLRELRGGARVVLVAHSTAGLAARAFTAAHPDLVAGLVTLGTPHGPAPLTVLDDPARADALRVAARLLAAAGTTGPVRDAVDHLLAAVDGWLPASPLPTPFPYPRARFTGGDDHGTGGVPGLAIAGQLSDDLHTQVRAALAEVLTGPAALAGTGAVRPPTHLGIGLRVGPGPVTGSAVGADALSVDVGLRVDATRLPLAPGDDAATPARVAVEIRLDRPGGWLVDPAAHPGLRVRRAELGVTVEVGEGAGPVRATAVFHDAAVDGPTAARVTLADPGGARLLGAVVAEVAASGETGAALVSALVALGLASRDAAGAVTVAADAVDALLADPAAFLAGSTRAALSTGAGLFGLSGPASGPWTAAITDLPLGLELAPDHLTVRLTGFGVAGAVLSGELTWDAGSTVPRISLTATGAGAGAGAAGGASLRWDTAAGSLVLVPGPSSDPVTLVPSPGPSALAQQLAPLLVERLVAAVASTALLDRLGPGWELGPITELLRHPEQLLLTPATDSTPPHLDGDRVGALLTLLGDLIGIPADADGPTPTAIATGGAAGRPGDSAVTGQPTGPGITSQPTPGVTDQPSGPSAADGPDATGVTGQPSGPSVVDGPGGSGVTGQPSGPSAADGPDGSGVAGQPSRLDVASQPGGSAVAGQPSGLGGVHDPDPRSVAGQPGGTGVASQPGGTGVASQPGGVDVAGRPGGVDVAGGPGGGVGDGADGVVGTSEAEGAGGGLRLPGGLVVRAGGAPCVVSVRTEPAWPVPGPGDEAGAVGIELDLTVPDLSTTPGVAGQVTLDLPLGGTWGSIGVALGLDGGEVSLAVTPHSADGTALAPIVLLPRFGGLGPLAAGAAALLPALLDALVARLPTPRPPLANAVLAIADAVHIHGGPGDPSFAAHTEAIRELAGGDGLAALAGTGLPAAVAQLWQVAGLPGTLTAQTNGVTLAASFGDGDIDVAVQAAWGTTPTVRVRVDGLAAGPVALGPVEAGFAGGALTGGLTATVALPSEVEELLGLRLTPSLRVTLDDDGPAVTVRPLGPGVDLIEARLLPSPDLKLATGGVAGLVEQVVLPLAAQAVLDRVDLDRPLVTGGPTAASVLRTAEVLAPAAGAGAPRLAVPLPTLDVAVPRVLAALAATELTVPLDDDLDLVAVVDQTGPHTRLGLGLHGHTGTAGDPGDAVRVSVRLGERAPTWLPDPAPALRLLVVEEGTWKVRPSLRLAPLGVRVEGPEGEALVDTDDVHLGAVTAYLWADMDLDGGFALGGIGGAVDLDDLGLPLGAVAASGGNANPVAASLLGSTSGAGAAASNGQANGDRQAVTPGVSLVAARRPGSPFALLRREDDRWLPFAERPVWFGIHRSFGPLAIDKVGFSHTPAPAGSGKPGTAELLVDGGVQVGPLTVQAHELGLGVPLDHLDQPGTWELDLAGLAVAFRSDAVSMAGGLVKRPGPPIDYAGIVTVQVAGRTFTAVGAYGRPHDQQGAFTSLFVFVGLPMVLGGPPCLFVTGLGGGAGYNRRLVPPAQITDVPRFPLVTAIDDGVNSDPAGTLARMGAAMPPQRGSLWLAAGLRFTSFSFVRSVAVLYVSLDRGVEIGLLGVAKASIPPPDAGGGAGSRELASVELALKARFSPTEGVLSVQAQLTDNSWLLSRDCQLTGGFAFVVWFGRDQFVLTLGGYHPSFVRPPEFPVVPRLGFHWAVSSAIVVKGESYFALTSSCVMAGGRLEVSFRKSGVYASFIAYADFLISWDPFHYDILVGVSVTAGFRIRVCFFACVTIDVSLTLGASVRLLGPPLRGEATLDLEVCSVTVAFGNEPRTPPTFLGWDAFRTKYVVAGAADGNALSMQALGGLIPPDVGAPAPAATPGSAANPWRLAGNFSLRSETRLAATRFSVNGNLVAVPLGDGVQPVPQALDLAPMNVAGVSSVHDLTVSSATPGAPAVDMTHLDVQPVVGHVPAAVWRITDEPIASAAVVPVLAGLVVSGQPRVAEDDGRPPISVEVIDFNLVPVPIGLVDSATPSLASAPAMDLDRALAELVASAAGSQLAAVGAGVLGPAGTPARTRAGLDPTPLAARSLGALRTRRSSPPLVTTLAASLATSPTAPAPTPGTVIASATGPGGAGAVPGGSAGGATTSTPASPAPARVGTASDASQPGQPETGAGTDMRHAGGAPGDSASTAAGGTVGQPAGTMGGRPLGEQATTTAGDTPGDQATTTAGDTTGHPAGTTPGDTPGDQATTTAGHTPGDQATTTPGDTPGDQATTTAGDTPGDQATTTAGDTTGDQATTTAGGTTGLAGSGAAGAAGAMVGGSSADGAGGSLGEGPRLRARLVGPAAVVPPPATGGGTTAEISERPAPATRAAVGGRTLVTAELGSTAPSAPRAAERDSAPVGAGSPVDPGEVQVWDLPTTGDAGRWLVSGPGAARLVFLDAAGLPLRDAEVAPAPGEEVAVTAPAGATRLSVAAVGAGPPVAGWQSGSLLTQVGRSTLLAPGASVHLPAPVLTRRDGLRTTQALVRAAGVVGPADEVETRLPATVEVVVVTVDAAPGTEPAAPPEVHIDGAIAGEPTVVLGGHRLYLAYPLSTPPPAADSPPAPDPGAARPAALGTLEPTEPHDAGEPTPPAVAGPTEATGATEPTRPAVTGGTVEATGAARPMPHDADEATRPGVTGEPTPPAVAGPAEATGATEPTRPAVTGGTVEATGAARPMPHDVDEATRPGVSGGPAEATGAGEPTGPAVTGGPAGADASRPGAAAEGAAGGVVVRVVTGADWHLAGVLGGPGTVDDWLPAITGAGSGVAVAPPAPAAPVTVRYEKADQEAS